MKNIILAVHERFGWSDVASALEEVGFKVAVCTSGDEVVGEIGKGGCDGLIVDQVIAPGEAFSNQDTEGGMQTGIVIARYVSKRLPFISIVLLVTTDRHLELPPRTSTLPLWDMNVQKIVQLARSF